MHLNPPFIRDIPLPSIGRGDAFDAGGVFVCIPRRADEFAAQVVDIVRSEIETLPHARMDIDEYLTALPRFVFIVVAVAIGTLVGDVAVGDSAVLFIGESDDSIFEPFHSVRVDGHRIHIHTTPFHIDARGILIQVCASRTK